MSAIWHAIDPIATALGAFLVISCGAMVGLWGLERLGLVAKSPEEDVRCLERLSDEEKAGEIAKNAF